MTDRRFQTIQEELKSGMTVSADDLAGADRYASESLPEILALTSALKEGYLAQVRAVAELERDLKRQRMINESLMRSAMKGIRNGGNRNERPVEQD